MITKLQSHQQRLTEFFISRVLASSTHQSVISLSNTLKSEPDFIPSLNQRTVNIISTQNQLLHCERENTANSHTFSNTSQVCIVSPLKAYTHKQYSTHAHTYTH